MNEEKPEEKEARELPICLHCGKENPPEASFCVHCHQPLSAFGALGPIENEKYSLFKTFKVSDPTERPITFITLMILFGGCCIVFLLAMADSLVNQGSVLLFLCYGGLCAVMGSVVFFTVRKYVRVKSDRKTEAD
jgi:ribosomal protein L40E